MEHDQAGAMSSRERILGTIGNRDVDHVPCAFMLYHQLEQKSAGQEAFVRRQLDMGLDAFVAAGHLRHSVHPDVRGEVTVTQEGGRTFFVRTYHTPAGPLTQRIEQVHGYPAGREFPLFHDFNVPRAREVLVKPEQDLPKLRYLFGPARKEDIARLREESAANRKIADTYGLPVVAGQIGYTTAWIMGADAMAWLSGYEDIMMLSLTEPDLIRAYADVIHQWNLEQIEIFLDVAAPDIIVRRAWYETTEFWTPDAYRTIIAPGLQRECELVHQAGKQYGYIITSAFLPLLDHILDAGIDVLVGLDPKEGKGTDLGAVKAKFRERKRTLWGGVSGAITVERGSEAETEAEVRAALDILGRDGGLILSPVDNVTEDTATTNRNVRRLIETWMQCRSFPRVQHGGRNANRNGNRGR